MVKRYFKGVQPHINIDKIEAEIAFSARFTRASFEDCKEILILREGNRTEGICYVQKRDRREECLRDFYGNRMSFCGDCGGRVARHCRINRRVHGELSGCIFNYESRIKNHELK